jgi:DNA-binding GntR family transcriptional regulator
MSSVRQAGVARKSVRSASAADTQESELPSSDQVVEHVTANILAGRYVPGQRLVESDLTQTLHVSRGPVREAFRRLDALGILMRTQHRGACVRTLTRTESDDLLLAVEPLAALATRLAAERFAEQRSGFDLQRFVRELRPFRDREEDSSNLLNQRRHFYDVLVAIGDNSALPSLIPTMRIHLLRIQTQSFLDGDNRRQHLDDYAVIAEDVVGGNARGAEKSMIAHLRRARTIIVGLPDLAFARPAED